MSAIIITPNILMEPCPFCRGRNLHAEGDSALEGCWSIMCDNPDCEAEGPSGKASPDDAAKSWNNWMSNQSHH